MRYVREYRGLDIAIEGYWSEQNASNLYRWRVESSSQVVPLESAGPVRDWHEAYYAARDAIDQWFAPLSVSSGRA